MEPVLSECLVELRTDDSVIWGHYHLDHLYLFLRQLLQFLLCGYFVHLTHDLVVFFFELLKPFNNFPKYLFKHLIEYLYVLSELLFFKFDGITRGKLATLCAEYMHRFLSELDHGDRFKIVIWTEFEGPWRHHRHNKIVY